jgi:hypothetical protein
VFKLFCSVQLVPFHNSVLAVTPGDSPPAAKALLVSKLVTVTFSLESFKSFTSVP